VGAIATPRFRAIASTVDSETWRHVREIESRSNERNADLAVVLVRFGFESGRRHPLPIAPEGGRS